MKPAVLPQRFLFHFSAFRSVSPALLRFALDRSCDMRTAPDQFDSGQAAWSPQAGTCPAGKDQSLVTQTAL